MDTKVVNKSQVKNALKIPGIPGNIAAALTMRIAGFDKLNEIYSHVADYQGIEFIDKLLEHLGITYSVNSDWEEQIPKSGKLLIVANHPFGGLDGMLALKILSSVRPDIKVLTNLFVAQIPNIKEYFYSVNTTYGFGRIVANYSSGLHQGEEYLNNGGVLVVFPSGEVSSLNKKEKITEDGEWQQYVSKIAKRTQAQIVPLLFDGENSWYFHFLQKISVKLSDWRLPKELSNKKGKDIKVRIGAPINLKDLTIFKDDREIAKYLRSRTYALEATLDEVNSPVKNAKPITPHIDKEILAKEIAANENCLLFKVGSYSSYLFDYEQIPNIIKEIGICREEAFRDVGEGTGNEIDLDEFDPHYKHLLLWDNEKDLLIGAYRLGLGADIIEKQGIKGFYSDMFFRFNPNMTSTLKECIELGRSFVSVGYQKDTMALLFLLKGLFYATMKFTEYKHLIGPVSISSWYPMLYRSLMFHYLKNSASTPKFANMVNPLTPFIPNTGRVDIDILIKGRMESLEAFDRYMYRVSGGKYRFPTLVKKYLKLGSKIIDYNVDPDFNDCLDCLIMLTLSDIPTDDVDSFCREFEDHRPIYKRFYGNDL